MRGLEQKVRSDLSAEAAYAHMAFLVQEVGQRLAGTESIAEAAGYIRAELEKCGLEARIDRFPIYHSNPGSAALRVVSPEERVIEALPSCHIPCTLDEGLTGALVHVGAGGYRDYAEVDAADKIVLADMTWAPPRPEKARIAFEKGAKALIISNWGAVKSVWGNPSPESFKEIPQLPAINITRAAGEYLKGLCADGEVLVWLRADATREWVSANQPVGVLRAGKGSGEFVLVGGHLEAWGQTAICNSSGNALMLELARVLADHRNELERDVVFAFWDGHEIAEAAGSTYYVDAHWDRLAESCVAYVNIDNPGIIGTSVPESKSAPEVKAFLRQVIEEVWGQPGNWKAPYKGGDQSFFGVGVPYISFATGYTPEELERLNWASLSPWLHTEADTLDKIDKRLYSKHLEFFATLIVRLCNAKVVPYDLSAPVGRVRSELEDLRRLSRDMGMVELEGLIAKAEQLQESVRRFEEVKDLALADASEAEETQRLVNQALINVSRELSVLGTAADKYSQDPYGYYLIGKPIPSLYAPLVQMKKLAVDDDVFNLWVTQFMRSRNRVSDILGRAIEHLTLTTRLIETRRGER
jgi:hypothetical protein